MLGILRGSLVTAIIGMVGDASDDSKVKIRRKINTVGPGFCQLHDWGFLHTVATFTLSEGTYEYVGLGKIPLGFQRFLACKVIDSNNGATPLTEKSLTWYNTIEDKTYQGTPQYIVLRGLDASGYQRACFYYCPDQTYTFEGDCSLAWADIPEAAGSDTTRLVITEDCFTAFANYVANAIAIDQGDTALQAQCESELYGNPLTGKPGLMKALTGKQRGARKRRQMVPDDSYIDKDMGVSDYKKDD